MQKILVLGVTDKGSSALCNGILQSYGIESRSRGLCTKIAKSVPKPIKTVAKEYQIDLSKHVPTVLKVLDLDWADTILCMDFHSFNTAKGLAPGYVHVVRLGDYINVVSIKELSELKAGTEEFFDAVIQIERASEVLCKKMTGIP